MRPNILVILGAALLISGAALTVVTPPRCEVEAVIIGGTNWLNQYRLEIRQPLGCPESLVRIRTRNGGILPPIGYFRIGGQYASYRDHYVMKGVRVENRLAPNHWVEVPIKGAPWQR